MHTGIQINTNPSKQSKMQAFRARLQVGFRLPAFSKDPEYGKGDSTTYIYKPRVPYDHKFVKHPSSGAQTGYGDR